MKQQLESKASLLKMCTYSIIDIKVFLDVVSISADFAGNHDLVFLEYSVGIAYLKTKINNLSCILKRQLSCQQNSVSPPSVPFFLSHCVHAFSSLLMPIASFLFAFLLPYNALTLGHCLLLLFLPLLAVVSLFGCCVATFADSDI